MSLQATLAATLIAGPASATDSSFPSGVTNLAFALCPTPKGYAVETGAQVRQVNSPSSYVALSGVGATDAVTQATTLFFRSVSPVLLRITTFNALGDVVAVVPVQGIVVMEFDPAKYLKLVEVQGAATVEYWASGNQ